MEGQPPAVYRRLGKIEQLFADAIDSPRNMKPIQAMLASFSKPAYHPAQSIFPIGENSDLGVWAASAAPQNCLHPLLGLSILQVSYHRKGMAATRRALHSPGENLQGLLLADADVIALTKAPSIPTTISIAGSAGT